MSISGDARRRTTPAVVASIGNLLATMSIYRTGGLVASPPGAARVAAFDRTYQND